MRNKLINFIVQGITLNLNRLFQILRIFYYCSIHIQSMTFAGIGKSWRRDHLTLLLNTTRQFKDSRCIITQLLMIYLESLLKYPDSLDNFLILKPITHPNLGTLRLLATINSSKILAFSDNLETSLFVRRMTLNKVPLRLIMSFKMKKILKMKKKNV